MWKDQLPKDDSYEIEVEGYKGNAMECAVQKEMVRQFWQCGNEASLEGMNIVLRHVCENDRQQLEKVWGDDKFAKMMVNDGDERSSFRAWVTQAVVMQARVNIDENNDSNPTWDRIVEHSHYKKVGGKPL